MIWWREGLEQALHRLLELLEYYDSLKLALGKFAILIIDLGQLGTILTLVRALSRMHIQQREGLWECQHSSKQMANTQMNL